VILVARDREAEDDTRPSTLGPHGSYGAVDERRSCGAGTSRERIRDGLRTADLSRRARVHGGVVGADHDIRVEHGEQGVFEPLRQPLILVHRALHGRGLRRRVQRRGPGHRSDPEVTARA